MPEPTNPLRQLREDMGLSAAGFARKHGVNVNAIQLAEHGCYSKPLPLYAQYLAKTDYKLYQSFRREQRRAFFPEPPPVLPLPELLRALNASTYTLGVRLCVQPADVYRMLKQERSKVPQEIINAFLDVGWSMSDVETFANKHIIILLQRPNA